MRYPLQLLLALGLLWACLVMSAAALAVWSLAAAAGAQGKQEKAPDASPEVQGDTPRAIIESILPIARQEGMTMNETPEECAKTNAMRKGEVLSGGSLSDHSGPGDVRWACDLSDGGKLTPAMWRVARRLIKLFKLPWEGSGVAERQLDGRNIRAQIIWNTPRFGGHEDHVHVGAKVVGAR